MLAALRPGFDALSNRWPRDCAVARIHPHSGDEASVEVLIASGGPEHAAYVVRTIQGAPLPRHPDPSEPQHPHRRRRAQVAPSRREHRPASLRGEHPSPTHASRQPSPPCSASSGNPFSALLASGPGPESPACFPATRSQALRLLWTSVPRKFSDLACPAIPEPSWAHANPHRR